MATVMVGNNRVSLDPSKVIGQGGEAVVYEHNGLALKIYHSPDNPLYANDPVAQKSARERIEIHQKKLPAFPNNLPSQVVAPMELAKSNNIVVGYTMKYLRGLEVLMRYSDKSFRQAGISNTEVVDLLRRLRGVVSSIHKSGVILGDFNDLNVLVGPNQLHICDADSFQYTHKGETFYCKTFTHSFVDPLLCDPKETHLSLVSPHNANSDWYAYLIMLFQSLLFVHPYGGVYKPKNTSDRLNHDQRPLHRITVFNPEVRYPKPATPFEVLPDEFLQYCVEVFEKDKRGEFPESLLDKFAWTKCSNCGLEHARNKCPTCATPGAIKEVLKIRGNVTASEIFRTPGLILYTIHQGGKLRWIYSEGNSIRREDRAKVLDGQISPTMRFRVQSDKTLVGVGSRLAILGPSSKDMKIVDTFGTLPIFDSSQLRSYWISNGRLLREGTLGEEHIGDVLTNQTLFWVGESLGFGFYRVGNITTAFTFHPDKAGINDTIKIPTIKGQLLDSTCIFHKDTAWFFISTSENGKSMNRCYMLNRNGMISSAETESGEDSWLGSIRGKCPISSGALMSTTDDGLVRVEDSGGRLQVTKEFPDTEPFVDANNHLIPGDGGIYVVGARSITLLKIR